MKIVFIIFIFAAFLACNSQTDSETTNAPAGDHGKQTRGTSEKGKPTQMKNEKELIQDADINAPAIGVIDMQDYTFRVHEIIHYHPSNMQEKMMKMDDSKNDYFILDCSIENKTNQVLDTGRDMLTVYYTLSDGNTYQNVLKGATVLASYNVDNIQKYSQKQYDLIWGNRFPAGGAARSHLFGVIAPEGATIKTIGFYKKNAAKNKFTELPN